MLPDPRLELLLTGEDDPQDRILLVHERVAYRSHKGCLLLVAPKPIPSSQSCAERRSVLLTSSLRNSEAVDAVWLCWLPDSLMRVTLPHLLSPSTLWRFGITDKVYRPIPSALLLARHLKPEWDFCVILSFSQISRFRVSRDGRLLNVCHQRPKNVEKDTRQWLTLHCDLPMMLHTGFLGFVHQVLCCETLSIGQVVEESEMSDSISSPITDLIVPRGRTKTSASDEEISEIPESIESLADEFRREFYKSSTEEEEGFKGVSSFVRSGLGFIGDRFIAGFSAAHRIAAPSALSYGMKHRLRLRLGARDDWWGELLHDGEQVGSSHSKMIPVAISKRAALLSKDINEEEPSFVSESEWRQCFPPSDEGLMDFQVFSNIRERIFQFGIDPAVRIESWHFLLEIYSPVSTEAERLCIRDSFTLRFNELTELYKILCEADPSKDPEAKTFSKVLRSIRADVSRTYSLVKEDEFLSQSQEEISESLQLLRSKLEISLAVLALMHPDIGYCQGMNDIMNVLITLCGLNHLPQAVQLFDAMLVKRGLRALYRFTEDPNAEAETPLTRILSMGQLLRHWSPTLYHYLVLQHDEPHIPSCFRWIVLLFQREFVSQDDTLHFWDSCWASPTSAEFELVTCAALLDCLSEKIIDIPTEDIVSFLNGTRSQLHSSDLLTLAISLHRAMVHDVEWHVNVSGLSQAELSPQLRATQLAELIENPLDH